MIKEIIVPKSDETKIAIDDIDVNGGIILVKNSSTNNYIGYISYCDIWEFYNSMDTSIGNVAEEGALTNLIDYILKNIEENAIFEYIEFE